MNLQTGSSRRGEDAAFLVGLARAFAGALLFALPMLMTMEMWQLGFSVDPLRLALLLVLAVPLLTGLSHYSGLRPMTRIRDDIADVFVALLVGAVTAVLALTVFKVLSFDMSVEEIVGKIAIQVVPASMGAMLARDQFGMESAGADEARQTGTSYRGELFLMAAGALFVSFNVAPTEEMMLIAFQMTIWHELALVALSLVLMHGLVYSLSFKGEHGHDGTASFFGIFARFTLVGYVLVLAISFTMLWIFGRTDETSLVEILSATIVLGFPGALGAAAARLIL
ncbi:TIGR02587 family membrane protein [Aurantimonas sp. 22II-16-19i]|uniref:TIGR02587 family membrane protein n=1 Tax=Aurantimonas sp. 22II-16-19i TaxID=1317114 RepID=UPI0009F7A503|nr:TIGR02587 family membrane protein [Aurantimonas sp. 22II-16-19i]ORE98610.1 hypothetical protein ATO4_03820 [Aurantimonas sp. 22II-16-19i]